MKKLIYILTIALTVSCGDQLERLPVDSLVEESAFQTVDDLNAGLRAVLGGLNADDMVAFNAIFTDNARIGSNNGGQRINLLRQILTSAQGDQGMWADRYNTLNRINRALVASESITPSNQERERYNNIVGQLYALRGYIHSELLFYYGLDLSTDNSLGVVYQNFVSTDGFRERNTTGEVLDLIETDFVEAEGMISSTDITYPTDDFINFQRARIALFIGDYSKAASLANALISKYPLATPDEYRQLFAGDASTAEVVFKIDNVQGSNNAVAANFYGIGGNLLQIEGSAGLLESFSATDIRKDVVFRSDSSVDGEIRINKYPPNSDNLYINDFKIMRIAEMYLIRAEANARLNQFGEARNDIIALRTARESSDSTPLYSALADAIEDIKKERRLELCYEGHRYLDIKRYRSILNIGIERDSRDATHLGTNYPISLPVTSEKWIFPIPIAELNGNPDITQAPGYTND